MQKLNVDEIGVFPETDPVDYLRGLARRQKEPGLLIEFEPLTAAVEKEGAISLSPADMLRPHQIALPLYLGFTSPFASSEVPHWHQEAAESYIILEGQAALLCKHRFEDDGWVERVANAGDILVVQTEVCHWSRWQSAKGLAVVAKAPQRAGVGAFPNGKTTCQFCPHFKRGCVLPEGFTPPDQNER